MHDDQASSPSTPGKKTLILFVCGALAASAVAAVFFALPAQYRIDPTGFGRLTGLVELAPNEVVVENAGGIEGGSAALLSGRPYRSDTITIKLANGDSPAHELEYKVAMKKGDRIVYSWTSDADPTEHAFYFDFHGETPARPGTPAVVAQYGQQTGVASAGSLTAPIEGVHGWYFLNDSLRPAVVKLKIAGFYELVPPGAYGNEAGVSPDLR